jgi:hypothetical protein
MAPRSARETRVIHAHNFAVTVLGGLDESPDAARCETVAQFLQFNLKKKLKKQISKATKARNSSPLKSFLALDEIAQYKELLASAAADKYIDVCATEKPLQEGSNRQQRIAEIKEFTSRPYDSLDPEEQLRWLILKGNEAVMESSSYSTTVLGDVRKKLGVHKASPIEDRPPADSWKWSFHANKLKKNLDADQRAKMAALHDKGEMRYKTNFDPWAEAVLQDENASFNDRALAVKVMTGLRDVEVICPAFEIEVSSPNELKCLRLAKQGYEWVKTFDDDVSTDSNTSSESDSNSESDSESDSDSDNKSDADDEHTDKPTIRPTTIDATLIKNGIDALRAEFEAGTQARVGVFTKRMNRTLRSSDKFRKVCKRHRKQFGKEITAHKTRALYVSKIYARKWGNDSGQYAARVKKLLGQKSNKAVLHYTQFKYMGK